jgi:hypothetical protein
MERASQSTQMGFTNAQFRKIEAEIARAAPSGVIWAASEKV